MRRRLALIVTVTAALLASGCGVQHQDAPAAEESAGVPTAAPSHAPHSPDPSRSPAHGHASRHASPTPTQPTPSAAPAGLAGQLSDALATVAHGT
ncbi:MAG: hypothetical protein J2O46_05805, partial [Nocardioides sp.]|nr:hypothetical protein [Nocardioides sp.]